MEPALGLLAKGQSEGQKGRAGRGFDPERGQRAVALWWWPLLSLHSSEDSVGKHQEARVTSRPRHRHLVAAGLGTSESSARCWSLTKQLLGQLGPPTWLPAAGQAGLPQA